MTRPHRDLDIALAAFARRDRVLVATDFDGVLAPLVDDPTASRPLPGASEALHTLAASAGRTVAVVSGRDLDSLRSVLGEDAEGDPAAPILLIGSHGAQSTDPHHEGPTLDEEARRRLAGINDDLARLLDQHPGSKVEHKPAGSVLHTRGMDARQASQASDSARRLAEAAGARVTAGKDVVELSLVDSSKGKTLTALAIRLQTDAVLYLGDDVTDETVFAALEHDPDAVTVKVGPGETKAHHRVDGPEQAVQILRTLAGTSG